MTRNYSRRRVLVAGGAVAVAVTAGAAGGATALPMSHPDRAILDHATKIKALSADYWHKLEIASALEEQAAKTVQVNYPQLWAMETDADRIRYWEQAKKVQQEIGWPAADDAAVAAGEKVNAAIDRMCAIRATTLEGLAAKASVRWPGDDANEEIAASIFADLDEINGREPDNAS